MVAQDRARDESQEDSEMADVSTMPGDAGATVWLWQWNRDTREMEKVGVPADAVRPACVEPLQRRYASGDRVLYTIDDEHGWQPGTVVKDQGVYVAIDGDAPGRAATTPKTLIRPLAEQPSTPSGAPSPPIIAVGLAARRAGGAHQRPLHQRPLDHRRAGRGRRAVAGQPDRAVRLRQRVSRGRADGA
jgi:hypothetical protein